MPANLPPQYFETEKKLRTAKTIQEKVSILEELLSIVPKHKGTEKLQALLKTKIAKLKSQSQKRPSIARHGPASHIEKTGAGQIILVGPPNSGKSSLVKALTNASPEIGDYPFTTHSASPAMMKYENIQIQLIDTPPVTAEYMDQVHTELIKGADALLIILDLSAPAPHKVSQTLLEKLEEKRIEIAEKGKDILLEQQQFLKNALFVANKNDAPSADSSFSILQKTLTPRFAVISVSITNGDNLDELKKRIFLLLDVVRVYSKTPGKKADFNEPFIFKRGSSLMDMAKAVHKDFAQNLRFARIWGKKKYQGQKVHRDYTLEDEDIIELHI
jgi:ribosome-interacting GTPase 1